MDKILKTLRDREIHRANSIISNGCHSIPSRFKVMDPNRSTFDSVVRRVAEKERLKVNSFRSLARSVLSKENRIWRQEQIKEKNNTVPIRQILSIVFQFVSILESHTVASHRRKVFHCRR